MMTRSNRPTRRTVLLALIAVPLSVSPLMTVPVYAQGKGVKSLLADGPVHVSTVRTQFPHITHHQDALPAILRENINGGGK